jgi:glutamate racemase
MDNRPIGVFDSGLGGLTAVKEFLSVLPCEDIVYFGDTGRVPYGSRSREILQVYARQDIAFLKTKDVKMIVAACGTVSSVAGEVGEHCGVPYIGVIRPTVEAALKSTRSGNIGVIATQATIASRAYEKMLLEMDASLKVHPLACPLFVPFVENGVVSPEDPMVQLVVDRYLSAFQKSGIDTLILGCTHYPVLREAIQNYLGNQVVLINSGRETALSCARILREKNMLNTLSQPGRCEYYVSDRVEGFYPMAQLCLDREMDANVRFVEITNY